MATFNYKTCGTCSRQISFEVDAENKIHNVKFLGGCAGNTQGVARLCEGRDLDEVHSIVKGVLCRNGTSCPDQLARAIEAYKSENL